MQEITASETIQTSSLDRLPFTSLISQPFVPFKLSIQQTSSFSPSIPVVPLLLSHTPNTIQFNPELSLNLVDVDITRNFNGDIDFMNPAQVILSDSISANNSTSMNRVPTSHSDFVRGKSTSYPFAPGGIDVQVPIEKILDFDKDLVLLTVPPGFDHGLFMQEKPIEFDDIFKIDDKLLQLLIDEPKVVEDLVQAIPETDLIQQDIDDLIPDEIEKPIKQVKKSKLTKEWAHMIDVNLPFPNFHDLVPDMAFNYPFTLDIFQKQAIYHLENGDSVFVAAHTSAGKTVVAEYAIALAQKHMTRSIYTSPIKALSNQKFRDFKKTFEDVGILTGDVQINPEASCLIMTTEILRSMLYRGADLIRDVEFVIFDEVHYINDGERGGNIFLT